MAIISVAESSGPISRWARATASMCAASASRQGLPLFGTDWDCSQQEIDDWAARVGVAPFRLEQVAQVQRKVVAKPVRR
ncbi:MAG: hypothetical protein RL227_14 [Pseudomonadota bacterium]|jgi:hypothetical protein